MPPKLISDPGVTYPQQALSERFYSRVEVSLLVELDGSGNVVSTVVEAPQGHGFDEAAQAAARQLRFEPALVDGTPVASRIRYRYTFEPPLPETGQAVRSEAPQRPQRRAPVTEPAPGEQPVEITVQGEQSEPTVASLQRQEVRRTPGALGDAFRAIEVLPGVTPVVSGFPFFFVRGSPPGNVGYLVDGIRVPTAYHVAFGPSVLPPGLVERVDLYPGAYPARYGRFAGAIVSAEVARPRPELHGEASVRLFDAGAFAESGFAEGRGTILLGGRYSYTAALISLLASNVEADYRDFQLRATYELTPSDRVSVFSFGSYDLLGERDGENLDILYASEFYRADVRYDHFFEGGAKLRTAVTLGYDRSHLGVVADSDRFASDRSVGARIEGLAPLGGRVTARGGIDGALDHYAISAAPFGDPDDPLLRNFDRTFAPRTDRVAGAWTDLVFHPTSDLSITPGIRGDLYSSRGVSVAAIEPRLSARYAVIPWLSLIPAAGIAHQPPAHVVSLAALAPSLAGGLQKSYQSSFGVELDFEPALQLSLTGFYNHFENMTDKFGLSEIALVGKIPLILAAGDGRRTAGRAFGGELLLKRRLSKQIGGLLSYTLSRSTRFVNGSEQLSATDQTHVVNAAASIDLTRGWIVGARGFFESGPPSVEAYDPLKEHRSPRDPAFHRLDVRLEKRWSLQKARWVSLVAEVLNATARAERHQGSEGGGLLLIPSLGVEGGF